MREYVLLRTSVEFKLRCMRVMRLIFEYKTKLFDLNLSNIVHSIIIFLMQGSKLPTQKSHTELKKVHTGPIYITKFNNDGEYCMTGSEDRSVCLYNPAKNLMIKHYKNLHNYDVCGLDISKDNSKFVTCGGDKNVIVTDVIESKSIRKFAGHNSRVNSVRFNQENSLIVSASYDTTVKFWDNRANSFHPIDTIKGFKDSVTHAEILDGYEIVCCSMDGTTRFYDVRTGQFICDDIKEAVQAMAIANSGRAYVVSALNNSMYLVERGTGNKVMEYTGHQVHNYNIKCCFNEDDANIFTGSADGKLYVYDIMKKQPNRVLDVLDKPLSAIDIHSSGGLVGAGHNGSVYHWKLS